MGEGSGQGEDPEEDEPVDEDAVEGGAPEENDGSTQAHKRNRSNESADEAEAEAALQDGDIEGSSTVADSDVRPAKRVRSASAAGERSTPK